MAQVHADRTPAELTPGLLDIRKGQGSGAQVQIKLLATAQDAESGSNWYNEGHEDMECKCIHSKSEILLTAFSNVIQLGNESIRVHRATHCFLDKQIAED